MRVLTWNLFHGRDFPPDPELLTWRSRITRRSERNATHVQVNESLLEEYAGWLASREWDIALLQEAPPRWLRALCRRTGAGGAGALTSRNEGAFLRAAIADRNPDLIASNEGGSNQLLVRPPARILEVRRLMLTRRPERRRMLWARVETPRGPLAVANLHASAGDYPAAARDIELGAERAVAWADGGPLILGGDLNLRDARLPGAFPRLRDRFGLAGPTAPHAIDHLLARGLDVVAPPRALKAPEREVRGPGALRVRLSDHAPVVAEFEHAIVPQSPSE